MAEAGAGEASQARTEEEQRTEEERTEEERTEEETSKDENSEDASSDEETSDEEASDEETSDEEASDEEASEDVYKVLAKIPLFIINFESSKIPPNLKPDAATRSSATKLWVADPQSPRAACGPVAWGGKLRTGDTLVQLLVFSGQEAIDCLREGAKANWPVERYIEKGYGCHIVEEYNTPELQAEHQRFWPHFVSAVQTVRMIATTAYMRFRISQLKKENPTMSTDQLTNIAMPEGKHYAEKTTAPVTDPLPTFAASLQQAIVSEQLKKMDYQTLQQHKKRKRGVSPQIIGGDGAEVAARLASPRHEQYAEDMGNWVREMVKETCDKDAKRRVKRLKDSRAKVFLGAQATTVPEVGPCDVR
ncbi:hypothetical protein FOMPIDRAFT_161202 [Fomitopsis schrenkii]|uniref:Uncharacterized protein n=1 Tax=Fomitopsis schrenkii TaxID=2126942 RepID=S8EAL2_FOMSC|nr:hypothetical protein FOMPIDRAFT_161202 [Fomitopsis schrenkii]